MIRTATLEDITKIMELKNEAVSMMNEEGNDQWNSDYPSRESFIKFIKNNEMYVYESEGKVTAMIVITRIQDPWYEKADWTVKDNYIVLHRLAVSRKHHGQGMAKALLEFAIDYAKENNIDIIKADTYSKNPRMPGLFLKMGFRYVGDIYFNQKPMPYRCYEFVLDKQSSLT